MWHLNKRKKRSCELTLGVRGYGFSGCESIKTWSNKSIQVMTIGKICP